MFLGKDVLQEKNYIFTTKTSSTYSKHPTPMAILLSPSVYWG